jgi:hypothetical protein
MRERGDWQNEKRKKMERRAGRSFCNESSVGRDESDPADVLGVSRRGEEPAEWEGRGGGGCITRRREWAKRNRRPEGAEFENSSSLKDSGHHSIEWCRPLVQFEIAFHLFSSFHCQ